MSQQIQNQTTEKNNKQKKTNLFADTEFAKNIVQRILITHFPGYLSGEI
jgi:hypothetical protein